MQLSYQDLINQAVGRDRGFRQSLARDTKTVVAHRFLDYGNFSGRFLRRGLSLNLEAVLIGALHVRFN